MKTSPDTTSVRQHQRFNCQLMAELTIAPEDEQRVVPSRACTEAGAIKATVVDCGGGGLGFRGPMFIPKGCRLRVRLKTGEFVFEAALKVMRVTMIDRQPQYYLGCAFTDDSPAALSALSGLIAHVQAGEG